jgi:hypothetical protein
MLNKLITIVLVTGFLTACGASGGGQADPDPISNGPSSNANISSTPTSVAASSVMSQTPSSIASSTASQIPSSSVASSVVQASSMMSSSRSSVSSSRSSSSRSSSSRSSSLAVSSSSSSSSVASSSIQPRQATIRWSHPTQRENGDYLELDEIGGYEIRVRPSGTAVYTYYPIVGNQTTSYPLNNYLSTMTVEIAVYDTQGLYSQFVTVSN